MSNTTPVPSPAQSPATPAGQTTVFPTVAPDPAAQPAPIPVPKPKRKLPRWIWSVGGGIVAAILFWIARDVLLFLIVVAVGFITGPKVRSMIHSWKQERERKASLAATTAGQSTATTAHHTVSNGNMIRWIPTISAVIMGLFAAGIGAIVGWQAAGYMVASGAQWAPWATWVSVGVFAMLIGALGSFIGGIIGLVARNILRKRGLGQ